MSVQCKYILRRASGVVCLPINVAAAPAPSYVPGCDSFLEVHSIFVIAGEREYRAELVEKIIQLM